MAKDLFSDQSKLYAQFRPSYPNELFDYILGFVSTNEIAWDCATGNGQAAIVLADHFKKVEATDISEEQIKNAVIKSNINYQLCAAEHSPFPENYFDLITIAQAYHWINWKKFHIEATRVSKNNAVIAAWCYSLLVIENDENLNQLIDHFYYDIIGPYWDAERKYVDEAYQTVEFNFDSLPTKNFRIEQEWSLPHLTGYIETWSAVKSYKKENANSPIELVSKKLQELWQPGEIKKIYFPIHLRIGKVLK